MSDTIKFKFTMTVPIPIPSRIHANDKAEIDISVVGFCEYDTFEDFGRLQLLPCNITAFMCPNCQSDTPPCAWIEVQTSDKATDRARFRDFYEAAEAEINDDFDEERITAYDCAVIDHFTKEVKVEKTTTYEAAQ